MAAGEYKTDPTVIRLAHTLNPDEHDNGVNWREADRSAKWAWWNRPWGCVGSYTRDYAIGGITTVNTWIGGVVVNTFENRQYKITFQGSYSGSVANDVGTISMQLDGVTVTSCALDAMQTYGYGTCLVHYSIPGTGSHTYNLWLIRNFGTGTWQGYATATQLATLLVEDIGPVPNTSPPL